MVPVYRINEPVFLDYDVRGRSIGCGLADSQSFVDGSVRFVKIPIRRETESRRT